MVVLIKIKIIKSPCFEAKKKKNCLEPEWSFNEQSLRIQNGQSKQSKWNLFLPGPWQATLQPMPRLCWLHLLVASWNCRLLLDVAPW
jgi:hypothetical protein